MSWRSYRTDPSDPPDLMDRYTALEKLQAAARREMAPAALAQFAPFREFAEELAQAALTGTDADFLRMLLSRDLERKPARLLREADPAPLALALERSMAPALVGGATGHAPPPPRLRRVQAGGKGKPCGDSWIAQDKECRLKISEPDWEGDTASMKARALASMAKVKTLSHPSTGIEMSMNREARKKTVLQAKSVHAYMAADRLTEIFLHSEPNGPPQPDRKGRKEIKPFHYFTANVSFGKSHYTAEITTTEYIGEETHHFKVLHLRPKK